MLNKCPGCQGERLVTECECCFGMCRCPKVHACHKCLWIILAIRKIKLTQKQAQYSLEEQLIELVKLANVFGLYDAADYLLQVAKLQKQ